MMLFSLQISGALAEKKRLIDERVKLQRDRMKQQVLIFTENVIAALIHIEDNNII